MVVVNLCTWLSTAGDGVSRWFVMAVSVTKSFVWKVGYCQEMENKGHDVKTAHERSMGSKWTERSEEAAGTRRPRGHGGL